jgi:hypothetical protein
MAVIAYTQDAALMGYQQWLMQQGIIACQDRIILGQGAPDCAAMPGAVVAQAGSQIRYSVLTTLSSATVTFSGQFQTFEGMWQNVGETVVGTSAGGIDQVTRPATAGCYKNMVASVGTAVVADSEVYVIAELGRTNNGVFQPYAVLVSGYIRTNEPIDSGGGPQQQNPPTTASGAGACICPSTFEIRSIDGIMAAQGWQDNYTPAANTAERVVSIVGYGTNGATVANRNIFAEIIAVGAGPVAWIQSPDSLTANQSYSIQGMVGRGPDFTRLTDFYRSLPESLWWSTTYQVQIGIGNFQVGDTIDDGYILVEVRS